jgi:hypothetical protein
MVGVALRMTIAFLASLAATLPARAGEERETLQPAPLPAITWDNNKQGWFVTSVLHDSHGRLWVGTEDRGLWRLDKIGWTQFTRQNTGGQPEDECGALTSWQEGGSVETASFLGDDAIQCLAFDKQGRLWVGHINHGVSVFNGTAWRNFDVLNGPLGERVFDIAVCPADGDVWMATSRGLARYRVKDNQWEYVVGVRPKVRAVWLADAAVACELPTDATRCLAFTAKGSLVVGTASHGLVIGEPDPRADTVTFAWHTVQPLPDADVWGMAGGDGLPSGEIHDVAVGQDGRIWVATSRGVAFSVNEGRSFKFCRGADCVEIASSRATPPPSEVINALKTAKKAGRFPFVEDATRLVQPGSDGELWVGHWRQGLAWMRPGGNANAAGLILVAKFQQARKQQRDEPSGLVCLPDGRVVVGWYGGGLSELIGEPWPHRQSTAAAPPVTEPAPLPEPAGPTGEPKQALASLDATSMPSGKAGYLLGEDWTTGGHWPGRYGRQFAMLFGTNSPFSSTYSWQDPTTEPFKVAGSVGPHVRSPDEGLRNWLHWRRAPTELALWQPDYGLPRESEWDDHGETYRTTYEGPNLHLRIQVPDGIHRVSAYFFNPNADHLEPRHRDYLVELRDAPDGLPLPPLSGRIGHDPRSWPLLAHTRVTRFSHAGVYQRFVVSGPGQYSISVVRGASLNAIANGIFIDRLAGPATDDPAFADTLPSLGGVRYVQPVHDLPAATCEDDVIGLLVLRQCPDNEALRWRLGIWAEADRKTFRDVMANGYETWRRFNGGGHLPGRDWPNPEGPPRR